METYIIYGLSLLIMLVSLLIGIEDRATKTSVKLFTNIGNIALSLVLGRLISSYIVYTYDLTFFISSLVFILLNIIISIILVTNRNARYKRRLKRHVRTEVKQSRNKAVRDMRAKNREIIVDRKAYRLERKNYFRGQKARTSRILAALLGLINGALISVVLLVMTHFSVQQFNIDLYSKTFMPEIVKIEKIEEIIEKV